MNSVTIAINDLFEFEGQPIPAQRPDNTVIEAMARRQFEFLRQPVQVEINENSVTVSFSEETPNAQDEAERLTNTTEMLKSRLAAVGNIFVDTGRIGQILTKKPISVVIAGMNQSGARRFVNPAICGLIGKRKRL